jgi:predicted nucleic acid-binding protein
VPARAKGRHHAKGTRQASREGAKTRKKQILLGAAPCVRATAWNVAKQLDHADTTAAEYVAIAQLQADVFVTLDAALARQVAGLVTLARSRPCRIAERPRLVPRRPRRGSET